MLFASVNAAIVIFKLLICLLQVEADNPTKLWAVAIHNSTKKVPLGSQPLPGKIQVPQIMVLRVCLE
jgi:hypothetical protein